MLTSKAFGQTIVLEIIPYFGKEKITTKSDLNLNYEAVTIKNFKFYLSNVHLLQKGEIVWEENNSFHLLDIKKPGSMQLNLDTDVSFDAIGLSLGIDSLTNVSGILTGDLDPTLGMYWTWQSGYINFKLEGTCDKCPTKKNEFEHHLGGYLPPFNAVQNMEFEQISSKTIYLGFDVQAYLNQVNLEELPRVMSPGENAVRYSKLAASCFYLIHD